MGAVNIDSFDYQSKLPGTDDKIGFAIVAVHEALEGSEGISERDLATLTGRSLVQVARALKYLSAERFYDKGGRVWAVKYRLKF